MSKSPEAFRTISEVADWLDRPAHVLRFWESKFPQVKPIKRAGGRRYYRPQDMLLLGGIKKLLHDDGLTIKGVQKILREQGIAQVSEMSQPLDELDEAGMTIDAIAPSATVVAFQREALSDTLGHAPAPPEEEDEDDEEGNARLAQSDQPAEIGPASLEPDEDDDLTEDHSAASMDTVSPSEPATMDALAQTGVVPEVEAGPTPLTPHEYPVQPEVIPAVAAPEPPQRQALTEQTPAPPPEPEPQKPPSAPALRPNVVIAPDAPPETEIEVTPGLLATLATFKGRLSADQSRDLAELETRLAQLRQRMSGNQKS